LTGGGGAQAATAVMNTIAAKFLTPGRIYILSNITGPVPTGFCSERKGLFAKTTKKMAQWFPTGPYCEV
jgi:hypothetical protein